MSKFIQNKEHSRTALIFCYRLKKTSTESYRLLREANDEHAPSQDSFGVSKVVIDFYRRQDGRQETRKTAKKFDDVTLQTSLVTT